MPQNMTPLELQTEVVKGYRHFYSLRRGLKYLVRLRFGRLLEHLWGWLYIRRWQRDPANRAYLRELGERSRHLAAAGRGAPQPPRPRSRRHAAREARREAAAGAPAPSTWGPGAHSPGPACRRHNNS